MEFRVYSKFITDTIHFGFKGVIANAHFKDINADTPTMEVKQKHYNEEIVVTREYLYDITKTHFSTGNLQYLAKQQSALAEVQALRFIVREHLDKDYPDLVKMGMFRYELNNFFYRLENGQEVVMSYSLSKGIPEWPEKPKYVSAGLLQSNSWKVAGVDLIYSSDYMKFNIGGNIKAGDKHVPAENPCAEFPGGFVNHAHELSVASKSLPGIMEEVKIPCSCYNGDEEGNEIKAPIRNIIMHLNDQHKWPREEIADWLETLDVDLTFKPNSDIMNE